MKKYSLIFKIISILIFSISVVWDSHAQERKLLYDVMRNGKVIGKITFVEMVSGKKKFLSMTSDVKTRFIFAFSDDTAETAAYDNGIMIYSSFYQKQTGSGTATKTTIASGKDYKLTDAGVSKVTSLDPIRYNMLLLYTTKPEAISKVYSANFQKHLDIKKMEDNKYRLTMPDGKFNYYTYKNGICTKVEIVRSLFTLHFVLREG
ncbi:MAG TPA: DUF6134 family protein [Chitinophagaceae bacterium]|nr:DUF6134 family protein [Chitinophagaceae bacterium]